MSAKLCNVCGIRRPYTGSKGTETASQGSGMCNYCAEEGGWENTHDDNGHADIEAKVQAADGFTNDLSDHEKAEYESFMPGCWICRPELNLAKQAKGTTGAHVQGARRPQLNHKGHNHPATPAARRACKALFWAAVAAGPSKGDEALTSQLMATWDARLDGFGKPLLPASPQGGWAGVAPLGPKGGTGASVKAAGAKAKAITSKAKASK